jgi:hypothetical protein
MGEACGTGGGGSGGGGSGGCGGERIGVAQEADACCCVVNVDGSPGQCTTVTSLGDCPPYTQPFDGACNPPTTGVGACSAPGARPGEAGVDPEWTFVILLAFAALGAMRRRFARRSGPGRSGRTPVFV